uniref:Selenoprotein Pb n=2 Tax=Sphaerodactylus townsendi TaxID=933632 RepID=A0ACB8F4M5_9SAUR
MVNVSFMIVNEKTPFSRAMYWELKRHAPEEIPVYQQEILEPDVWKILDGNKDDFLIYDRCGKLTFHIRLPHSFLHFPYVEAAVHHTYHKDYCGNCSWYYSNSNQEISSTAETSAMTTEASRHHDKSHNHAGKSKEAPSTVEHTVHHFSHHTMNSSRRVMGLASTYQPVPHNQSQLQKQQEAEP